MKLNDLDPCLWQQYDPPSTSTNFDFPDLNQDTFAELKPLPPFEYIPPAQTAPINNYDVSTTTNNIKTELVEYLLTSDIDDIAALIGSAIAEQTPLEPVTSSTVDPWTELDAWIQTACHDNNNESSSTSAVQSSDYLPSIVTEYTYSSPILQARLQSSPQLPESTSSNYGTLKVEPSCYNTTEPHFSPTVTSTSIQRFKKCYNGNKTTEQQKTKKRSNLKKTTLPMTIELADKEKPVHRCGICNRGFLNKSNIKVHLRTHTGEKPFKCEVCGKAFRQKAHLLKHVQIHKRITRD